MVIIEQSAAKRWWRAVWRGLVVDHEGKHYRMMGPALWLLLYLIIHADRDRGVLSRKYKTIAADMGISQRTVRSWLTRLRQQNYVSVTPTGRSLVIHIRRWKSASALSKAATLRPVSDTPGAR